MDAKDQGEIQQVVKETKDLVKALEATSVRRLTIEGSGYRIEIERAFAKGGASAMIAAPPAGGAAAVAAKDGRHRVLAPLVGTFYRSATPGSKSFIEVGSRVQRGQTIGIVEAMKIMNEIASDAAGVVVEILAENGQPVQYEQPLVVIDTAA